MAAIESASSVLLIGTVPQEPNENAMAPECTLEDPRVGALAVLTRAADREYWVRKAADCGRHVLCEQPVFSAHRALKLSTHCHHSGVVLCVADRFSSEPERVLREALADGALGTIVFIALDVFIPRDWTKRTPPQLGVVTEYGAPFAVLLQDCFGPIDSIYARTRSLVANRPQEDIAVSQLRFKDGMEGTLQINALGSRARVCIAVYGSKGSAAFEVDLHQSGSAGLHKSYQELGQATTEGSPRATAFVEGLFVADWIHQSARHNTEVPRRKARLG